jgi:hypothetical protein
MAQTRNESKDIVEVAIEKTDEMFLPKASGERQMCG